MIDFHNAPIRRKLLVIIMLTTAIALALAGIGMVALDSILFQRALRRDLLAMARIAGENSTAALTFDDPQVATETLSALRARPHMVAACIYRENGSLFARYTRTGAGTNCPPPRPVESIESARDGLRVYHPILLHGT